jgi:hypothetical protein
MTVTLIGKCVKTVSIDLKCFTGRSTFWFLRKCHIQPVLLFMSLTLIIVASHGRNIIEHNIQLSIMFFKFLDLFDSCNVQAVTIFPFHFGGELYIHVQNTLVNPTVIDQLESKFLGRYNHTELTRGLALKAGPFYKFRPKFSPCVLALISIDTVIFSSLDDNNNTSILKSLKPMRDLMIGIVQAKENPSFICFVQTMNSSFDPACYQFLARVSLSSKFFLYRSRQGVHILYLPSTSISEYEFKPILIPLPDLECSRISVETLWQKLHEDLGKTV